ncbi:MAG: PQQ-like beta-propeller repeat protein, partial [Planctomycetes bacterium]|nr:PQQ-like beta-propeller repeat protein [Planctomycetota bacterium]
DHYVYALDAASGFTRWAYHVGARLQSRPAPAVGILDQIAAQQEQINVTLGKVEKARAEKNREDIAKFENELRDAKGRLTTVEDGDLIYLMAEDRIHCLDRLGGHHYWTQPLEFSPSSPLFATTQYLLVGSFQLQRLHAIDVRTRTEAWFARLAEVCNTTPVHVDPSTYVTSNDGSVYALANDGQAGWQYKTEKAIVADPVVWENTLFVGSTDYALYALDRNTGVVKWKLETTAPITRTPVVSGKTVYVRSDDNLFLAVGVDGKKKWGVPNGERFLGRTQHWTWVLMPDWEIVGVNEATGNIEARYSAGNFPVLVSNPDSQKMYFATHDGLIFCATESKVNF